MNALPVKGTHVADIECPLHELLGFAADLNIGARIHDSSGDGYLLMERGKPAAAYYTKNFKWFTGQGALDIIRRIPLLKCAIYAYSVDELEETKLFAATKGWGISESVIPSHQDVLDEKSLGVIANQPGVIAVSAFFEGFPVFSVGNGDFERVAAIAEDLLRTGKEISLDMGLGMLDQMILETDNGKVIIAPVSDLFLCVETTPDAHLGLIRLAIRGIQ